MELYLKGIRRLDIHTQSDEAAMRNIARAFYGDWEALQVGEHQEA